MKTITFTVMGESPSEGSLRAFPFRRKNGKLGVNQIHQDAKGINVFRAATKEALKTRYLDVCTNDGDIGFIVKATFYIYKPKTAKRLFPTRRNDKDLDKRVRALLDALTISDLYNPYGVFKDDSQVIYLAASKKYVTLCDEHILYDSNCEKCKNSRARTIIKITQVENPEDIEMETDVE